MIKKFFQNIFNSSTISKIENIKSFNELYSDLGIFKYYQKGFAILSNKKDYLILWSDIIEINVYKKDLFVHDLISMEILIKDGFFTINEETAGWFQFVSKLQKIFRKY